MATQQVKRPRGRPRKRIQMPPKDPRPVRELTDFEAAEVANLESPPPQTADLSAVKNVLTHMKGRVVDVDDFDEGEIIQVSHLPPGLPKQLNHPQTGKMFDIVYYRVREDNLASHPRARFLILLTPDLCPHVPKHYFNVEGVIQQGKLILCAMSKEIHEKILFDERKKTRDEAELLDKGGIDGVAREYDPTGRAIEAYVKIKSALEAAGDYTKSHRRPVEED